MLTYLKGDDTICRVCVCNLFLLKQTNKQKRYVMHRPVGAVTTPRDVTEEEHLVYSQTTNCGLKMFLKRLKRLSGI